MGLRAGVKKPELEVYRLPPSTAEVENEWSYTSGLPTRLHDVEREYVIFTGALVKLRKATVSFVMSVRPSARNNSALTGRIFMKFDIGVFFESLQRKFRFR